jgi:hypothetical protein
MQIYALRFLPRQTFSSFFKKFSRFFIFFQENFKIFLRKCQQIFTQISKLIFYTPEFSQEISKSQSFEYEVHQFRNFKSGAFKCQCPGKLHKAAIFDPKSVFEYARL